MYNAYLQRTKETITALNKHVHTSERFRTAVFDQTLKCARGVPCFDSELASTHTAPDRLEWRVIDHCAAVTRLYAIYEQFAHEMVREHLELLQRRLPFQDLPESIRSSYRVGMAKVLDKKDGPRFADLDLGQLIEGYNRALTGNEYALEARAILMQEQNLRLPELHRFMSSCGVDGVAPWVENHRAVRNFFAADDRLTASAESQMAELIKYRNDAAHGSIDISDVLHVNVLTEFCDFIYTVCEALAERVQLVGLQTLKIHGHVTERGKVTESMRSGTVAIGAMVGEFQVGTTVYLCGETYCLERNILSLQLEGMTQESVDLPVATELGMLLDAPGKRNAVLLAVEPLPTASFNGGSVGIASGPESDAAECTVDAQGI